MKNLKTIPGLMRDNELDLLCRMAMSAKTIVELGTWQGRSMAAMMLANPQAKVWGVDWFEDMWESRGYNGTTEEQLRANLKKLGLEPAGVYNMTTNEAAKRFRRKVDLLHVDAGHSYQEVVDDISKWVPKVNPGGAVCFHDYGEPHSPDLKRPDVQKAVDEWRNPGWVEVERSGVMVAFRQIVADRGVLYIAYGDEARNGARQSIATLREHSVDLPVAVVSDEPLGIEDYHIYHPEADMGARTQKTRMYSLSPFRKTLYLDADTKVRSSPDAGFGMLNMFDIILTQDIIRIFADINWPDLSKEEMKATKAEIGFDELLYWNSGVIFFNRNERNRKMFQAWHEQWLRWKRHDQMALLRAIHRCPVRIGPMREPWNTYRPAVAKFVLHEHRKVSRAGAPK